MTLLAPALLGLLGLLPVVLLLYFLKLKRQEKAISSTYLWRKAIQDLRVNSPLQKLRKNLLLWLQLALLALLILGRARPTLNLSGGERRSIICLVDTSASMCATDESPSRLDAAKGHATRLVGNMRAADRMMLVTFDSKPTVLAPYTSIKSHLKDAIADIEAKESATDFDQAAQLIAAFVRDARDVELYVISDGGFELDRSIELPEVTPHYIQVGSRGSNVGITALDARRNVEYEAQAEVFARVENFSEEAADVRVELHLDGELFDARGVHLAAGGKAGLVFSDAGLKEGLARVAIVQDDDLDADDEAWIELVEPKPLDLLVVTPGNYFLELALMQDPLCSTVLMDPEAFEREVASGALSTGAHDVVIFDRHTPLEMTAGAYLFLGGLPPLDSFSSEGQMTQPAVIDWDAAHPVNRYVGYSNIFVENAIKMRAPPEAHTLVEGQGGPLIVWWSAETYRVLVVGFDMFESRWPLRVSFPIFLANAIRHLGAVETSAAGLRALPGQAINLSAPAGVEEVEVTRPDGEIEQIPVQGGKVTFANTGVCGPYVFTLEEGHAQTYVVNLLDPSESDIKPRESISWTGTQLAATAGAASENREIWRWFALVALGVLMLEWYVYNRRVYF